MTKKQSLFICLMVISLLFLVLFVQAQTQTQCPSPCTCMLPSDAAKMKGYTLCGGKQVICGYDKTKNPLYCYQKTATDVTTIQTTVTTTSPSQCPSPCNCLLPSEAKAMGNTALCGGMQVLCGYDRDKNAKYCYEKPITRVPTLIPTKPTSTPTTLSLSQPYTQTVQITVIPTSSVESPTTTMLPIIEPLESIQPTTIEVTPLIGSNQQEQQQQGGIGGFINTIISFFRSIFGGGQAPQRSSRSLQTTCNGILTDLMTDPDNCGSCGIECDSGSCIAGRCTEESRQVMACGAGAIQCNNTCKYFLTDEENCGGCGNVCPPGWECCTGWCIPACPPGYICINRGCHNTSSDPYYCGEHWEHCNYSSVCCDGACSNLDNDEQNCGECGNVCNPDFTCCSGGCANLSNFPNNCGECGHQCLEDEICCKGSCCNTSEPGITCCRDGCKDVFNDRENCGRCGDTCPPGEDCYYGDCQNVEECEAARQARNECWDAYNENEILYSSGEISESEYYERYYEIGDCRFVGPDYCFN